MLYLSTDTWFSVWYTYHFHSFPPFFPRVTVVSRSRTPNDIAKYQIRTSCITAYNLHIEINPWAANSNRTMMARRDMQYAMANGFGHIIWKRTCGLIKNYDHYRFLKHIAFLCTVWDMLLWCFSILLVSF